MELSEVQRRFADYGFYHTIELAPGVRTPGWPVVVPLVELTLRSLHSLDLRGKRVLDVGCRDGLFAFEAERLGAREVVAIDNDLSRGAVEVLIPFLRSRVRMHEMNLLDLRPETFGTFDVVIMPGVLYHLRYPFWALKLIRDLLSEGGCLVLETALFIDDNRHAVLRCPVETDSPYEATSCTFFNRKGLIDTLGSLGLLPLTFEYLSNAPLVAGRPVSLEPASTNAPRDRMGPCRWTAPPWFVGTRTGRPTPRPPITGRGRTRSAVRGREAGGKPLPPPGRRRPTPPFRLRLGERANLYWGPRAMTRPRFSVVIPTRERAHTLRHSLRTCLDQDFEDYEVVVCDNYSSPATREVVEEANSPRVRYVRAPEPLAMSHNWELALSHAAGEYVTILGDDDALLSHALRELDRLIRRTGTRVVRWMPRFTSGRQWPWRARPTSWRSPSAANCEAWTPCRPWPRSPASGTATLPCR